MKFIENLCLAYVENSDIYEYSARNILEYTSLYIVPMCNPDGVNLVTGKIKPGSAIYNQAKAISNNYPSIHFPSRLESKYRRCRFKSTISCSDGKKQSVKNLIKALGLLLPVILLEKVH